MSLTQKSHHKTCYTTHGETAKQGILLNFGNLQDTEEKRSVSNTGQKKSEYKCWLPCQPVWVELWNTILHRRDTANNPNRFLTCSVQGRTDTFISVLVTTIQVAGVSISKSKHMRELQQPHNKYHPSSDLVALYKNL